MILESNRESSYTPTLALSVLAIVLYAILFILHVYRTYAHRLWAFSSLLLLTCAFEVVGYGSRLKSSPPPVGDPYLVIPFIIQYFFIVVGPVFLSAGLYTILTSMIYHLSPPPQAGATGGEESATAPTTTSPPSKQKTLTPFNLSRRAILLIFITADILATIIQVAGAAMIGAAESNDKSPTTPNNILLAGLAFQVVSFLLYLLLLIVFLSNARKNSTASKWDGPNGMMGFSIAVVIASLFVYVRTVFRMAETAEGIGGYASSHEAFFGALEFAPVVLAVGILAWWHPGRWFGKRGGVFR